MKELIEQRIEKGNFELKEILKKIDIMYIENKISIDEKRELEDKARQNARPEASYASPQAQINALSEEIKQLRQEVKDLADRLSDKVTNSDEVPEETLEEESTPIVYPEYRQPLGSHDAYRIGDKVSFNGKIYKSTINGNVWSPTEYPQVWIEIGEENTVPTVDEILSENNEEPIILE